MKDTIIPLRINRAVHFTQNQHSIATWVDDELVLLEPTSGVFFGLRGSAIALWQLLPQTPTVEGLSEALLKRYQVEPAQLNRDISKTLTQLKEAGLVQCSN